ncbi:MAG: reverse transcriptase family protein [Bacilli bacterium]|nr:reverse transcriptase family protein [Bacilli bacterium]
MNSVNSFIISISESVGVEVERVNAILSDIGSFYKETKIKKHRRKGFRTIMIPSSDLKSIQRVIVNRYLRKIRTSSCATAYISGKSIVDNVLPHIKNKYFFHSDIHDFFDNIKEEIIFRSFRKEAVFEKLSDDDLMIVIHFLTYKGHCCQGAPSTPMVSNIVMKSFDKEMKRIYGKIENGKYTRYSDDITISSSSKIGVDIKEEVKILLKQFGFEMNDDKTFFSSEKGHNVVTGLSVNNKRYTVSKKWRKMLDSCLYHLLVKNDLKPYYKTKIVGMLNYLKMSQFNAYESLMIKYNTNICSIRGKVENNKEK